MILPKNIQEKLIELASKEKLNKLKNIQKSMTEKYKTKSGSGQSLIESKADSLLYCISRMPATYSVILTLLMQLKNQGLIDGVKDVFDIGSGTGAGYFALKDFDADLDISLFERDKNMIEIFNQFETGKKVNRFDLTKDEIIQKADLVLTSYVLSELSDEQRNEALKKLLNMTNKYLLIIDTGTPQVWKQLMILKQEAKNCGAMVLAPCNNEKCPLVDDYCQFFARVERTSLHRIIKDASLSYEDEKYFYLLISKTDNEKTQHVRVIRRPIIKPNIVELKLCSEKGIEVQEFTKKNKEEFKRAKKLKINDLMK